jgi:hypothetical protein
MKKILLIFLAILGVGISSCQDIINSDPNRVVLIDSSALGWQDYLEFRFSSDYLTYSKNDTTVLWEIKKTATWGKPFYVVNNYRDSVMTINNISLIDGKYFEINKNINLPIVLLPGEADSKNTFSIVLKTINLESGIYYDKIIINDDKNSGLTVRVNVFTN